VILVGETLRAAARPGLPRWVLRQLGGRVVVALHWLLLFAGLSAAVLRQALQPASWRRTVRAEFIRMMRTAGVEGLPTVLITGALIGLAMVYQALYWLAAAGQTDLIGQVLVVVLVREIGPLLVGLIVIGRSGTVLLIELGTIRAGPQYHMLQAAGIDPFLFLAVPRVLALALSTFCLTVLFLGTALLVGFFSGHALGAVHISFYDFFDTVFRAMGPSTYALLPIKSLAIGFAIGLVCAATAMRSAAGSADLTRLMPRGFVRAVLACLLITGAVSVAL